MFLNRMKKNAAKDADPRERSLWADLLAVGMIFPIAIVVGLFAGRWIGGKFGHQDLGQWLGLAWGVAAGFWELYKTSQKLDRFDAAEAKDARDEEAAKRQAPMGSRKDEDDDQP
ncbi:MAG TPA: AtpZ/AtpI family protein [Holophagaceae bacterium]|nr:AtpZ/AtpI family protein [Holophagaceae bacterium]